MLSWCIYSLPKVESVFEQVSGLLGTTRLCQTISVLTFRHCDSSVARLYWCTLQLIAPADKGAQKYQFYLLLKKEFKKKNLLNSFPRFDATNPEICSSSEVLIVADWKLVTAVSCWTDKNVYLFWKYIIHVFTDFLWCNWLCKYMTLHESCHLPWPVQMWQVIQGISNMQINFYIFLY